jgi:hypothetical protein
MPEDKRGAAGMGPRYVWGSNPARNLGCLATRSTSSELTGGRVTGVVAGLANRSCERGAGTVGVYTCDCGPAAKPSLANLLPSACARV